MIISISQCDRLVRIKLKISFQIFIFQISDYTLSHSLTLAGQKAIVWSVLCKQIVTAQKIFSGNVCLVTLVEGIFFK
jgi:hypothetical protein